MPAPDSAENVRPWIEHAEGDWTAATLLLKHGTTTVTDNVGFHAQQCVEKYLKALIVLNGLTVIKTHNLRVLLELLPAQHRPAMTPDEYLRLTDYATVSRYPGSIETLTLTEARRAVTIARRVRREVRAWLPKAALKP